MSRDANVAPVVLVTGGARRVGAATTRLLHDAGARVMIHYRQSAEAALQLADALNARRPRSAAVAQAALEEAGMAEQLVAATLATFGRLDGLVNNASSFFPTPLGRIRFEDWEDLMGSNLKGPLFLAQAAAPALKAAGGAVVNITDVHAERPLAGFPVYSAAKAGLLGLTRALAIELAPEVRVNAVAPGPIQWPEDELTFPPAERDAIIAHTLLKRCGRPEDIASTVKFLLFDAPYITGQVINVDGGRTAHL